MPKTFGLDCIVALSGVCKCVITQVIGALYMVNRQEFGDDKTNFNNSSDAREYEAVPK